jgi:hypothetical protein
LDNNNLIVAKELFTKYDGSFFFMDREGEYDKYRQYGISKEQEILWTEEIQQHYLLNVKNEDVAGLSFLALAGSLERSQNYRNIRLFLEEISVKADKVDTFTQLLMAENVMRILSSIFGEEDTRFVVGYRQLLTHEKKTQRKKILKEAEQVALDLLSKVSKNPITVAPYYHQLYQGKLWEEALTPQKILERALHCRNDLKKIGGR